MNKTMTRFLRRLALVFVTALALGATALPALAQELAPEHLALARKYVDLTDKSGVYEATLVNTGVQTMRTILTQKPDISKELETAITRTLDGYRERKGELFDQFARLYAARFTADELQKIVDFYSSPVGIKLANSNAQINSDLTKVINIWQTNLEAEFYAKVKAELKAAGIDV